MSYLSELIEYHFPNVSQEELLLPPYKEYVDLYCEKSVGLLFYRGYTNLSSVDRAKIYRAIDILGIDKFLVFNSEKGLVIKTRSPVLERIEDHISDDRLVFVPDGYDRVSGLDFVYYYRLLKDFRRNVPSIRKCPVIRMNERGSVFICLVMNSPPTEDLKSLWRNYLSSGPTHELEVPLSKVFGLFRTIPWKHRTTCTVRDDRLVIRSVGLSLKQAQDYRTKLARLEDEPVRLVELSQELDEHEALGLLTLVNDPKKWVPLIGSCFVATLSDEPLPTPPQLEVGVGVEIFTQEDFSDMSSLKKCSLVQAPSGKWYPLLSLLQSQKYDPLTREEFSESFRAELTHRLDELNGPLLNEFPPEKQEPQLLVTEHSDCKALSFFLMFDGVQTVFWQIPDLRNTEWEESTIRAINVLTMRWSDHSLFVSSAPRTDPLLMFRPHFLQVFWTSRSLIETEPSKQARRLDLEVEVLSSNA